MPALRPDASGHGKNHSGHAPTRPTHQPIVGRTPLLSRVASTPFEQMPPLQFRQNIIGCTFLVQRIMTQNWYQIGIPRRGFVPFPNRCEHPAGHQMAGKAWEHHIPIHPMQTRTGNNQAVRRAKLRGLNRCGLPPDIGVITTRQGCSGGNHGNRNIDCINLIDQRGEWPGDIARTTPASSTIRSEVVAGMSVLRNRNVSEG